MSDNNIKILLIDDEEEFVSTLAQRLEFRGYKAHAVNDGQSGIDLLDNESFDIVILDLMMHGLNGIETLKLIKNTQPNLPVILLTGHGSTKAGMEGMRLGAADYLMKPLDIKDLIDRISTVLKQ
ncbi:MAG: response regulator [Desulfobacterales bacterium]|nr:response regulator [Desulfobacterales bacterium]MCP4160692.1 response regulator [Deltaproteobacteria bacterium]